MSGASRAFDSVAPLLGPAFESPTPALVPASPPSQLAHHFNTLQLAPASPLLGTAPALLYDGSPVIGHEPAGLDPLAPHAQRVLTPVYEYTYTPHEWHPLDPCAQRQPQPQPGPSGWSPSMVAGPLGGSGPIASRTLSYVAPSAAAQAGPSFSSLYEQPDLFSPLPNQLAPQPRTASVLPSGSYAFPPGPSSSLSSSGSAQPGASSSWSSFIYNPQPDRERAYSLPSHPAPPHPLQPLEFESEWARPPSPSTPQSFRSVPGYSTPPSPVAERRRNSRDEPEPGAGSRKKKRRHSLSAPSIPSKKKHKCDWPACNQSCECDWLRERWDGASEG